MSQNEHPAEASIYYFDATQAEEGREEASPREEKSRVQEIEARLNVLETAILEHAIDLRERIGTRLDRLEEKLRYETSGLRKAVATERGDRHDKIIQLTESFTAAMDRVEVKSQAEAVQGTMEDLIAALSATRSHLDTLASAVSETRVELPS